MKAFVAAVGLCISLVVSTGLPALAAEPQENPDNAAVVYDGVALLQKYSQVLDDVLAGDAAGVQQLQTQAALANLPPELGTTVGSFFSSAISLASLLPSLQKALDDAKTFLSQYRVDDAKQVLDDARQDLTLAYSSLLALNISTSDTASRWQADIAPAGSTLHQAYDDVQAKLLRLHGLLGFNDNIVRTVTQQTALPPLSSTSLSLLVEPAAAFVGENVSFHGILASANTSLPGRQVTILLDHSPVITVTTAAGGAYQGVVALPFRYSSFISVQAVYSPQGDDINRYLGCSSPEAPISVLFYPVVLHVAQSTPASPGRDFLVQGAFNYGNNTVLPERRLNVYLDNNLIFDGSIAAGFYLRLPVSANTSAGTHRLTFDVPGAGRYAPAGTTLDIEVSRIVPAIELNIPRVILLPFPQQIRGSVRSAIGPLSNTPVEITLGNWETAARTGTDGSFSARLDTGFSLTFLGAQDLRVTAVPPETWYQSGSTTVRVMVINPANIAGIIIMLLVLAVSGTRRLGRKAGRPAGFEQQPFPDPGPVLLKPESVPAPPAAAASGDPRAVLLSLYRGVLHFVQQLTGRMLPPHQTLREFAAENEPKLGPVGRYFREFTLMIERLLYSRHDFDERDAAHARELSGKVLKGTGNEDS